MDGRMEQAAGSGDTTALYQLIGEDPKILEHINEFPFIDTPLHTAACNGKIKFALNLMNLKPSFARKLNPNGFSPMHLALQNRHIELVRSLLRLDGDLARVKGKDGLTPLHSLAASGERPNLLEDFLLASPDSITDVTVRNDTVLHIALQNDKLMVFKFLVTWLVEVAHANAKLHQRTVLNWKNIEGNTVLHIAVKNNQTQAVSHLLAWGYKYVDVNHKNLDGDMVGDILRKGQTQILNEEIQNMLRQAKAKLSSSLSTFNRFEKYQKLPLSSCFQFYKTDIKRDIRRLSSLERRGLLMVVTALLVTIIFQSLLNPPSGLWQDNGTCNTTEVGSGPNGTINLPNLSNTTLPKTSTGFIMPENDNSVECEHKARTAIAFKDGLFQVFLACNTILFLISNSLVIVLIPNGYMKVLSFTLNVVLCFNYSYGLFGIVANPHDAYIVVILMAISAMPKSKVVI